jgi:hypothetical protein
VVNSHVIVFPFTIGIRKSTYLCIDKHPALP